MRALRSLRAAALTAVSLPLLVALPGMAPTARAATGTPTTVPALRQWTAGAGAFTFTDSSRVVVDPVHAAQLTGDAETFAADLSALEGRTVAVVQGTAGPGDIALTLGGSSLPAEGYTMTVGSSITIQGGTTTGEFWGTRTVLQLLHQSPTIAAGSATDFPAKAERGLMLDTGRRFFGVPFVEDQIRDMAYLKMNYLHLHVSDTYGFRLESTAHPEVTSAQHYSKQDIAHIIAVANKYHVTVVPEIDTPGHMDAILSGELSIGKDYRLKDRSGNISNSFIDLTIPGARALISDLINEYLPLFTNSPYWHIGADEYVTDYSAYPQLLSYARANYGADATAKDTYYGYVNWADSLVRAGGKTTRMWNDGIKSGDGTITPDARIIVEYWYNYGLTPRQLIDAGHTVANESWTPTYYVYGGAKPDTRWMYETWQPDLFQGGNTITDAAKNLGSLIHVWCDNPSAETENQTAAGIKYPMRGLAQMTWGSPKPVSTYAAFVPIMDVIGRNPQYPTTTIPGDLALGRPTTASSTETTGFPASNATDGDLGSRWSSAYADPTWIQVDLGTPQTVNRVVLAWENAYGKDYRIQVSNDGTTWSTVYTRSNGTGGTETLTFPDASGRYIRVYGTARGTSWGYSLYEFEVFHQTNLARGRPATASSVESGISTLAASNAVDGSSSTRWSSDYSDPQWLRVDLGATHTVDEVKVSWEAAYGKAYQIQVSDDAVGWTTIYSTTAGAGGVDDLTGLNGSGRYIRLYGTARGTGYGYSLWEFAVYGT
ncbi:galactose-binding domain-containing protein [Streptomyces sp. NPDC003863]